MCHPVLWFKVTVKKNNGDVRVIPQLLRYLLELGRLWKVAKREWRTAKLETAVEYKYASVQLCKIERFNNYEYILRGK